MMKKITTLFVLGIVALTMVACSNDEVTEEQPKEENNDNKLEELIDEPLVEIKEDEMHMSGGVTEETRNAFVKSVSVPEGSFVGETNEGDVSIIVQEGTYEGLEIGFLKRENRSLEGLKLSEQRALEFGPNGEVEVNELDVTEYNLTDFNFYFSVDLDTHIFDRIGKVENEKGMIISVKIPKSIDLEKGRQVTHAIINSAQYE